METVRQDCKNHLQKLAGGCWLSHSMVIRGCSYTVLVFMVRQLAEKAIEHDMIRYFFVDLHKAYGTVL